MFRLLPFVVLGTGLVATAVHLPVVALVALAALAAPLLPVETGGTALVLVWPVLGGVLCIWLTLASWLGTEAHPSAFLAFSLALVGVLRARSPWTPRAWQAADAASLLSGLAAAALLAWPFAVATAGTRLALMSRTADASTHVQMVRAVTRTGGYLMLLPHAELSGAGPVSHYPPAFSGIVGSFAGLRDSSHVTGAVTATLITVLCVAALLAAACTQLAHAVLPSATPRAMLAVLAGAIALLTVVGPTGLLLEDGAYAQMLALLGLLACMLLASRSGGVRTTVCLALASVLTCQAWYLVAPALLAPWMLHLSRVARPRRTAVLTVLTTGPFAAYPVVAGPGPSQLHVAGFIDLPGRGALVVFAMAALWAMVALVSLGAERSLRLLLLGVVVLLLLGGVLLGVVQIAVSGSLSYYFFKVLVAAAVVAVPLIAAAITLALPRAGRIGRAGIPAFALVALVVLVADPALRAAVRGTAPKPIVGGLQARPTATRGLSADQTRTYFTSVLERHPQGLDQRHEAWLLGCSRGQDYVLTKWLYDLSLAWTPARSEVVDSLRFERLDTLALLRGRAQDPTLETLDVYYVDRCSADVVAGLRQDRKVTLRRLP